MSSEAIRVTAKTVADALTEASIQLGTSSDNIEYTVIDEGSKGFFGIGGRKAVIEAKKKFTDEDLMKEVFGDMDGKPKKEPRREPKKPQKKEAPEQKKSFSESKKDAAEPKKSFSESKKDASEPKKNFSEPKKDAAEPKKNFSEPKKKNFEPKNDYQEPNKEAAESGDSVKESKKRENRRDGRREGASRDSRKEFRREEKRDQEAASRPAKETAVQENAEAAAGAGTAQTEAAELPKAPRVPADPAEATRRAEEFLGELFRTMEMNVSVTSSFEDETLSIDIAGDDMGLLIGKRGQTLDSLQYLTSLVVNKGKASYVRVKLDTEDYRNRRKATLENLAKNIAFKVRKTRRPVFLEPMNPYERRIIHSALQNDPYVTTHSEGDEPCRKVVVTLRKDRAGRPGGDRRPNSRQGGRYGYNSRRDRFDRQERSERYSYGMDEETESVITEETPVVQTPVTEAAVKADPVMENAVAENTAAETVSEPAGTAAETTQE